MLVLDLLHMRKSRTFINFCLPLIAQHIARNRADAITAVLDAICDGWKKRPLSVGTDGASTNTGRHNGAVILLQRMCNEVCSANIHRTWCGLHQLDLIVKKRMPALWNEDESVS